MSGVTSVIVTKFGTTFGGLLPTTTTLFAGHNNIQGATGDGDLAVNCYLYNPRNIWGDTMGKLFIADLGNDKLRVVSTDGTIWRYAGLSTTGGESSSHAYQGFFSASQALNDPRAVWGDTAGNVFVGQADVIEMVTPTGALLTIGGTGNRGPATAADNFPATLASVQNVYSLYGDTTGNLYFTDYQNFM
eukprot:gene36060-44470_t